MCGIVGMAGNIVRAEHSVFRDMLLFDTVRGQDSTGVLKVNVDKNEPDVYKDIGHPCNLWDDLSQCKWFNVDGIITDSVKLILGHNRFATVGKVTVDNAHPFSFDHITGVHNGTLDTTYQLEGNHNIDSQKIFHTISKKGIEHTWNNLNGAASLVWWDEKDETLNFIRNSKRPMFMLKSCGVLLWASESWMITYSLLRNRFQLPKVKDKTQYPESTEINHLYKFKVKNHGVILKEKKKLEPYTPYNNYYSVGFGNNKNKNTTSREEKRSSKEKINQSWARGLKKADKSIRGKNVLLKYGLKTWDSIKEIFEYRLVGEIQSGPLVGTRVDVLPQTIEEYEKLDKSLRDRPASKRGISYKLIARPRMIELESKVYPFSFIISSKYVKKVEDNRPNLVVVGEEKEEHEKKYEGYQGVKYTEEEYKRQLSIAGQACVGCDRIMEVDDVKETRWLSPNTIICNECSNDPFMQSQLNSYYFCY